MSFARKLHLDVLPPDTLMLVGHLGECVATDALSESLKDLHQRCQRRVRLDFSRLERVNSIGIEKLFRSCSESHVPVLWHQVPLILADQLSHWCGYFSEYDFLIDSFEAPFFDSKQDSVEIKTLTVGRQIPLKSTYDNFDWRSLLDSGEAQRLEPDFDSEVYFYFLTSIWARLAKE